MSFELALFIDVVTLLFCTFLLVRHGKLSMAHPGTTHLFFHAYSYTFRLATLARGGSVLFSHETWGNGQVEPMHPEEITQAVLLADAVLAACTGVWLSLAGRVWTRPAGAPAPLMLNRKVVHTIVVICAPFALFGFVMQTVFPGLGTTNLGLDLSGEVTGSGYYQILQAWPGSLFLLLVYVNGFRSWLVAPMSLYLAIIGLQGYHRVRMLLPILMLIQFQLARTGRKWPRITGLALIAALAFIAIPLKSIGKAVQSGQSAAEVAEMVGDVSQKTLRGKNDDQTFLDQFACTMTLIDQHGDFYYGQPYLGLIALPVPRALWPEKPTVTAWIFEISTKSRPMGENGMIVTLLGEAYANFGYFGVFAIPTLLSWVFAVAYFRTRELPVLSVARLTYLVTLCTLMQVHRDGLPSLVMFTFVNLMPIMIVVVVHMLLPGRVQRTGLRALPA